MQNWKTKIIYISKHLSHKILQIVFKGPKRESDRRGVDLSRISDTEKQEITKKITDACKNDPGHTKKLSKED